MLASVPVRSGAVRAVHVVLNRYLLVSATKNSKLMVHVHEQVHEQCAWIHVKRKALVQTAFVRAVR